jgi:hypothetical protein
MINEFLNELNDRFENKNNIRNKIEKVILEQEGLELLTESKTIHLSKNDD